MNNGCFYLPVPVCVQVREHSIIHSQAQHVFKTESRERTLVCYRKHRQNTEGNLAKYIIFFGKKIKSFFFSNQARQL